MTTQFQLLDKEIFDKAKFIDQLYHKSRKKDVKTLNGIIRMAAVSFCVLSTIFLINFNHSPIYLTTAPLIVLMVIVLCKIRIYYINTVCAPILSKNIQAALRDVYHAMYYRIPMVRSIDIFEITFHINNIYYWGLTLPFANQREYASNIIESNLPFQNVNYYKINMMPIAVVGDSMVLKRAIDSAIFDSVENTFKVVDMLTKTMPTLYRNGCQKHSIQKLISEIVNYTADQKIDNDPTFKDVTYGRMLYRQRSYQPERRVITFYEDPLIKTYCFTINQLAAFKMADRLIDISYGTHRRIIDSIDIDKCEFTLNGITYEFIYFEEMIGVDWSIDINGLQSSKWEDFQKVAKLYPHTYKRIDR